MMNRITKVALGTARGLAKKPGAWALIVRDTVSGFRTTAHHALMAGGVLAIFALTVLFFNPQLADHVKLLSPFADDIADQEWSHNAAAGNLLNVQPEPAAQPRAQASALPLPWPRDSAAPAQSLMTHEHAHANDNHPQQQRVTIWIAKRYRVATDATHMLVSAAYSTAKDIKLDPLLILAVMAIESRFNPFAESPVGAQGLMQVMSKVHRDKFQDLGGVKAALNPVANIKVGSLILKEYVRRGGSVEAGLKLYVGAADSADDSGYGAKVLAEYRKLQDVASGKRVPIATSTAANAQPKQSKPEEKAELLTETEHPQEGQPA